MVHTHDLAVMGGGSGGVATALAAARMGLRVVIIERDSMLGGTATQGGVNCWETGVGGTGLAFEIFLRLKHDYPGAVGICSHGRHFSWQAESYWPHALDKVNFPGGEFLIDPKRRYTDTLRRHPGPGVVFDEAWTRAHWHCISFLLEPMAATLTAMLEETGNVEIRLNTTFSEVHAQNNRVAGVTLSDGSPLHAAMWVDACGGAFCHALGCKALRGTDPRSRFNEPSAPAEPTDRTNAVTLLYKVMPGYPESIEPLPADIPAVCWWTHHFPALNCVQAPDGGRNFNMLPTMEGKEATALGYTAAYAECERRVKADWHFVQTYWPEFRTWRMTRIAPMLGIGEGRRVVCEKMLTENDIRLGLNRQSDPDIIAIADHALDRHGESGGCPELDAPYGVPFRCLIPKGWLNLLIACRAAGFSSLAASSCRLTRTMIQLGQAAGTAIALTKGTHRALPEFDSEELRDHLREQHVQLEWPTPVELTRYMDGEPPWNKSWPHDPLSLQNDVRG